MRVVAIDGVALEDSPRVENARVESVSVLDQRRQIREAKDELRRLRAGPWQRAPRRR